MTSLTYLDRDERSVRRVQFPTAMPIAYVTGKLLAIVGAIELVTHSHRYAGIPGIDRRR